MAKHMYNTTVTPEWLRSNLGFYGSFPAVARALHVPLGTVKRIAAKHGIRSSAKPGPKPMRDDASLLKVLGYSTSGKVKISKTEVAKIIGMSRRNLHKRLARIRAKGD